MAKLNDFDHKYSINSLKGRIGQAIIEIALRRSGYQVYPYGYENHFAQIVQTMAKQNTDETVQMVRSTPDFYVFDEERKEGFVVEVKLSYLTKETYFLHETEKIDRYIKFWPRAYLVIVCARSLNIYIQRFDELGKVLRLAPGKPGTKKQYQFDLKANFSQLPEILKRIDAPGLSDFKTSIYLDIFQQLANDVDES